MYEKRRKVPNSQHQKWKKEHFNWFHTMKAIPRNYYELAESSMCHSGHLKPVVPAGISAICPGGYWATDQIAEEYAEHCEADTVLKRPLTTGSHIQVLTGLRKTPELKHPWLVLNKADFLDLTGQQILQRLQGKGLKSVIFAICKGWKHQANVLRVTELNNCCYFYH